jgi:hypothetical protein
MTCLKLNGKRYVVEYDLPDSGDRCTLRVREPATKKKIAHLTWNTATSLIVHVRVGYSPEDAAEFRRHGIATALLRLARRFDRKLPKRIPICR